MRQRARASGIVTSAPGARETPADADAATSDGDGYARHDDAARISSASSSASAAIAAQRTSLDHVPASGWTAVRPAATRGAA